MRVILAAAWQAVRSIIRVVGLLSVLFLCAPAFALTVDEEGSVICETGKRKVFWQEDNGVDPKYRDVVVLDYEKAYGVLVYQEHADRSMVMDNKSSGTNIPWRWLSTPDGKSYGTFRSLPVDTSLYKESMAREYGGQTVDVLIIGASFYWPVCALASSVDKWFINAEIPAWHKDLNLPSPQAVHFSDLWAIRSDDQTSNLPDAQTREVGQDQPNAISRSMLALRDYGQQACEFWIGKPSGSAHGNLTKGPDWLLFMMFPLSLPRDQRLQTARKPKDRGRLRRFREPNKIHIL